jgi:hypothetical protein
LTDKIVFVRSYAHAEQNGIKPCDTIIGTVFNASKNAILAYAKGHTFSSRDDARQLNNTAFRTFEFWLDEFSDSTREYPDLTVFADREFTAKVVFFETFGNLKAQTFERITKLVSLGDARMNPVNGQ